MSDKKKIIVIDDEPDFVMFLTLLLEDNGYETISAKDGQRVFKTLQLAKEASESRLQRVPTSELNEFLRRQRTPALTSQDNPKRSFLKYACQVGVAPPTFVLFTRGRRKLHFSTIRFISNRLRESYGFFATPLKILQRPSRSKP